jgi:hypothetical protein
MGKLHRRMAKPHRLPSATQSQQLGEDEPQDHNANEVNEAEDSEITEQARQLKTLSQYQQDILRLQGEKEQLGKPPPATDTSKCKEQSGRPRSKEIGC